MLKKILLNKDSEYITLGQFLKFVGLVQTGGEAKYFLEQATIQVNGQDESRRGKKLRSGDQIRINGTHEFLISES